MHKPECIHSPTKVLELSEITQSSIHPDKLNELAEFFKAFSDPTRLKIILALSKKELCVCKISDIVQMSQSAVSHQLKYLKNINIVKCRREGKSIMYSLSDMHISHIYGEGLVHISEEVKNNG